MNKVRIELNKEGLIGLLQSQEMMDGISNISLKEGEIDTSYVGFDRVQVIVKKEDGNADRADNT